MHLKARGWLYTCPRRWLRAAGSVSSLALFPEGGSAGPAACRRGDRRRGDVSRGDCRGDCSASAVRIGEERRTRASELVDGCPLLTLIFKYLHTACTALVHGIGRNDHSHGMKDLDPLHVLTRMTGKTPCVGFITYVITSEKLNLYCVAATPWVGTTSKWATCVLSRRWSASITTMGISK